MHLTQLFIFIFASKHSSVSLQSHPQDTLCTSFQAEWRIQLFRLKFAQKMDIGLEFQKINLRIRINILEILCVCVHVCVRACVCVCVCVCVPIFNQNKQPRLFQTKNKIINIIILTFSAQISPKMALGLEIQKTNGCNKNHYPRGTLPIFKQSKQL